MTVPDPRLPSRVTVYEVGPRDGLQNEKAVVPVEVKAEFIARLVAAGLPVVEATSFVHPRWVPQLADAEELLAARDRPRGAGCRCWSPTSAGSTGPWPPAYATSRSSAAPPRRSRRRT